MSEAALTLRSEQIAKLDEVAEERFENWMVAHIRECLPDDSKELSEESIRQPIRCGIERGESYGIESGPDLCSYIDIMVMFGRDFDVDQKLTWAQEILSNRDLTDPADRGDSSRAETGRLRRSDECHRYVVL